MTDIKRFPPSHASRAKRIQDAFANFLNEVAAIRNERKQVLVGYLKRVEDKKIAEIKKKINEL
jgi:hypothetical protein